MIRTWRTSSYSGANGNCVEVSLTATDAALRDSKNTRPELTFSPEAWHTFLGQRTWRTSSFSGENGDCVQVSLTTTVAAVRDSKNTVGPALDFTPTAWQELLDHLAESR